MQYAPTLHHAIRGFRITRSHKPKENHVNLIPSPPQHALSLHIASTWDARSLPPQEHIALFAWDDPTDLHFVWNAPFYADPPPAHPIGNTPRLWEHEVFEIFVAGPQTPDAWPYLEMEFGPHGHYLLLQLSAIRTVQTQGLDCTYLAERQNDRWFGYARVPLSYFPPQPWTWNAYAIHREPPQRRYLAAFPVPAAQPDFHQPTHFRPFLLTHHTLHPKTQTPVPPHA
jgi:hypothetical protein